MLCHLLDSSSTVFDRALKWRTLYVEMIICGSVYFTCSFSHADDINRTDPRLQYIRV